MKRVHRLLPFIILLLPVQLQAQHLNKMDVALDADRKTLIVKQEIVYHNQSRQPLNSIILNDWNNAYSSKTTPLARRFADEYIRAFHIAPDEDRGSTIINSIHNISGKDLIWQRPEGYPDLIEIALPAPLPPGDKAVIVLQYEVKLPNDRFTRYGHDSKGNLILKNWYITPARFENGNFVMYSNENLDDIANAVSDYEIYLTVPEGMAVTTDLNAAITAADSVETYSLSGKNRLEFSLTIEPKKTFEIYRNKIVEVSTNLTDRRITNIQKALFIDQITKFTADNLGNYPFEKIVVTQVDYDRNPVYGLNQLPAWLSPFPDSFMYEIRFLKTYLNAYLKNVIKLDPRKDAYIIDGIQMYLMMKYVEEYYPDKTMMGLEWGILRGHNLFTVKYNDKYSYLYLLMARKNLDQPIGDPKNTLIKFNEQIAGKYRSGLSFNYLDSYLGKDIVPNVFKEFYQLNLAGKTTQEDFKELLKSSTDKNIDWFFDTVVNTRELIDFKISDIDKKGKYIEVTIENQTGTNVPVSLYGVKKNGEVSFKQWLDNVSVDTTLTVPRQDVHKLVLNYNSEIPEFNRRNNTRKINKFIFNRPVKFTFFQDLEDPAYNQVFYVPSFIFNLYDGVAPGLRFHNKSLLEKPFIFDIEPTYSPKTNTLIGSASFMVNQYVRDEGPLYNIRYSLAGSTYHYAPDAAYIKCTPAVSFRFRDEDLRKNKRQNLVFRNVLVNREKSDFVNTTAQNENYSVFNARFNSYEADITRQFSYLTDVQVAKNFGKLSGEIQFRRLFNDNRQINLRFYAGMFMYRSTNSDFFSFGVDRPNDYMFDYNLYGRSETSGLFSQQYVMAEGGFKSMLDTRLANQWLTTVNASFNIWNWIEVYGDAGLVKNKYAPAEFIYDSGIRLNLLPDYFELYFPVYSSNGFELNDAHYAEKIRFVVTISPGTLINLFTRKWF